jgi:hypothetical protein
VQEDALRWKVQIEHLKSTME